MDSPFIGQIQLFAFNYAPEGWMLCQGQLLNISQNQALFALIGITYGGDGRTNFALPNLQGASPLPGMQYYIAIQGLFPPRS
ncbi:MAG: tail fiber protein [Clostridia bacterium]|nr:tail fiber protein [Clostridia bacterium]